MKRDGVVPSKRRVYSNRLVPVRKHQSLMGYAVQDANRASDRITKYTLEHEVGFSVWSVEGACDLYRMQIQDMHCCCSLLCWI